ncbi:MAG: DUF2232 domain-containing protein [Halanaerobiaceae bacterium]
MDKEMLKDGIRVLLAIFIMTLANFYLPFLSVFILIIWPVPVVYMTARHDMKYSVLLIIIAAVVNGLLLGPMMGLITIIGFGFVGFVLGGSLKEGFTPLKSLLLTIGAVIVSQGLILFIATYVFAFDINQMIEEVIKYFNNSGELSDLGEMLNIQLQMIKTIFPGMIIVSSIITGVLNYYISLWYLHFKGIKKDKFLPVKLWRFPRWIIAAGLIVGLIYKSNPVLLNLNIILFFLVFMQGFAVGLYYIEKSRHKLFFRWLHIFGILFFPPLPVGLILTALVDMWFNLRKLG